jgi:acetyl esterase/lipase
LICAELCLQLRDYEVNIVSYPLAPSRPAPVSIAHLQRLYRTLVSHANVDNSRTALMGDLAGGSIALLLGIYGASEYLADLEIDTVDSSDLY